MHGEKRLLATEACKQSLSPREELCASISPRVKMSVPTFSSEIFGVPDFRWMRFTGAWQVFCNRLEQLSATPGFTNKLYHVATLAQCKNILHEGIRVGLEHPGSKSSQAGIWGCNHPGQSMDRAPLSRGYTFLRGWDCPIVLARIIDERHLKTHDTLSDGTCIWVHKLPCGTIWNARVIQKSSSSVAHAATGNRGRLSI